MKTKLLRRWVRALRSGSYGQSKGSLRQSKTSYDVLGVLCDVYSKMTGEEWHLDPIKNTYKFLGESEILPYQIVDILGLTQAQLDRIIVYNDIGALSFNDFSYYIEKKLLC